MLQGFAAVNKRLSSGGVLTGLVVDMAFVLTASGKNNAGCIASPQSCPKV